MKDIASTGITMRLLLGGSGGQMDVIKYTWTPNTEAYNLLIITYFVTEN